MAHWTNKFVLDKDYDIECHFDASDQSFFPNFQLSKGSLFLHIFLCTTDDFFPSLDNIFIDENKYV